MKDTKIQWHPAFVAAMSLEFKDNREDLIFEKEYNLNTKPLEVSLEVNRQVVEERIGDGDMLYDVLLEIMEPQLILREREIEKQAEMRGEKRGEKQGEMRGEKRGEFKTLYHLVCDNLLTMEAAAASKNLTVEEFQEILRELSII